MIAWIGHLYRNPKGVIHEVVNLAHPVGPDGVEHVVFRDDKDLTWTMPRHEFENPNAYTHLGPKPRPSRTEYFFGIVQAVSARGTCSRRRVGAIAVGGDRVLSTGYNGAPSGARHCAHDRYDDPADDPDLIQIDGRWSCSRVIHAEANVLAYAARHGVSLDGATIYCDTYPCYPCAKAMISAGIAKVVFQDHYANDPRVETLSVETGLVIVRSRPV